MSVADLVRIDKAIEIAAPVERVWRALTDPRELAAWFRVKIEGPIQAGSDVWMTSEEPGYEGQRFLVTFRELLPPTRMVWEWHPGAVDPSVDYSREARTIVTFALEPSRGGTRLSVSETGFDAISLKRRAAVYKDNNEGWDHVIARFAAYVESAR